MPSIVDELKKLNRLEIADIEHDCTANEVASTICRLVSGLLLKDDYECGLLDAWAMEISELKCEMINQPERED